MIKVNEKWPKKGFFQQFPYDQTNKITKKLFLVSAKLTNYQKMNFLLVQTKENIEKVLFH